MEIFPKAGRDAGSFSFQGPSIPPRLFFTWGGDWERVQPLCARVGELPPSIPCLPIHPRDSEFWFSLRGRKIWKLQRGTWLPLWLTCLPLSSHLTVWKHFRIAHSLLCFLLSSCLLKRTLLAFLSVWLGKAGLERYSLYQIVYVVNAGLVLITLWRRLNTEACWHFLYSLFVGDCPEEGITWA